MWTYELLTNFLTLAQVQPEIIKEEYFVTYTAAHHQKAAVLV